MLSALCLLAATAVSAQEPLYTAKDFTAENLFSSNIEGPCFDKDGNLYVVNFGKDGTVGSIKKDGTGEIFVTLPEGSVANSIKFSRKGGEMYLADFKGHNVLKVEMKTKKVSIYLHNPAFNQPNDFCITKGDHLYVSDPNWQKNSGKVWFIAKGGRPFLLADSLGTTNGIELSPDEKVLYVNESVQRKVWRYDVGENFAISNKKLLAVFPDFGLDGMKCDKAGNLYVTRYGKGTIVVLNPAGDQIREIPLKGKSCSNLVFGGEDGKTVFVTLQDRKCMESFRVETAGKGY